MRVVAGERVKRGAGKVAMPRQTSGSRRYFTGVAEARYVLRKVFRLVEDEAKRAGLDPLAHQALIQIYGSRTGALRVKEVAERLDIIPAFASSLIKSLAAKGWISRLKDKTDSRVTWVKVTPEAQALLRRVDRQVQIHVDYFTQRLTARQTEAALSILTFYAGVSLLKKHR